MVGISAAETMFTAASKANERALENMMRSVCGTDEWYKRQAEGVRSSVDDGQAGRDDGQAGRDEGETEALDVDRRVEEDQQAQPGKQTAQLTKIERAKREGND